MEDPTDSVLQPGEVLAGKYQIERLVGRGGMAEVYAAYHQILHQLVAVKVLMPHVASAPGAAQRFLNEARAAARIRGEHVTTVMDVGALDGGGAYMVLEYLEGEDLEAYAGRRGPLPVAEMVDYILEALEAVAQAHALGIVHRDLKPSNLFLARRPDGSLVVKVLDFGISKAPLLAESASGPSTASQVLLGSPVYMAPEQARNAKSVDARADVWAIGVTLFRLLSGQLPFAGTNLMELLLAIAEQVPPPLRTIRADLPVTIEAIVERCLSKNREYRFPSVAALALALEPLGGPEARGAVDRVCRSLGTTRSGGPAVQIATVAAPEGPVLPPESVPAAAATKTASSWVDSRSERARRPGVRILVSAGIGVVSLLVVAAAGIAWRQAPSGRSAPTASAAMAQPASPPSVAASPVAADPVLPVGTALAPEPPAAPASSGPPAIAASTPPPHVARHPPQRPTPSAKPAASSSQVPPAYDVLNQRN